MPNLSMSGCNFHSVKEIKVIQRSAGNMRWVDIELIGDGPRSKISAFAHDSGNDVPKVIVADADEVAA